MDDKYFKKIIGKKCYLSPLSMEDAQYYTEWMNDFSVSVNLNCSSDIINLEKEKELLKKLSEGYTFAIIDKEKNKLIGTTGFINVEMIHKTAEFGISIGERNFWNRGYGTEAVQLMLDYGFNLLNLHHVRLGVFSFNPRALKCYEKAGFKLVGKFSEYRLIGGEYFDMLMLEILSKDFKSPYIKKAIEDVKTENRGGEVKIVSSE
jgi:RimJ/RimL family protein N-acetyltransferase